MLTSVIITVYNQEEALRRALASAVQQRGLELEIVVADDHSSVGDHLGVVREFNDPRVKYFYNTKNLGKTFNYRKALHDYASGDFCTILNADDYYIDPDYLCAAARQLQDDPSMSLVFGRVLIELEGSPTRIDDHHFNRLKPVNDGDWLFANYPKGFSLPQITSLFRRRDALQLDFYHTPIISEDLEGFLRLIQGRRVGYIDKPSGVYVRHRQNATKSTALGEILENDLYIESAYRHARKRGVPGGWACEWWRLRMLHRYYTKWVVKLCFLDPSSLGEYVRRIWRRSPLATAAVVADPRTWVFFLLRHRPGILRWLFRHVVGQESFIADLQENSIGAQP